MSDNGDLKALDDFIKLKGKSFNKIEETLTNENYFSYKIYIRLQPTCVLKKVRLFIIFRELSEIAQICFTNPKYYLLEAGDFTNEFEIYLISDKKNEEILGVLESILEIENKVISKMSKEEFIILLKNYFSKELKEVDESKKNSLKSEKTIFQEDQSLNENTLHVQNNIKYVKNVKNDYKSSNIKPTTSTQKILTLTDLQKDGLKEIGNIGAGNAANALARLINRRVDINVPLVEIIELDKYFNKISNENLKLFVSWSNIVGDCTASILIIFKISDILKLISIMIEGINGNQMNIIQENINIIVDFPELYLSALSELVHILTNHYIIALGNLLDINLMIEPPEMSIDTGNQLNMIINDKFGLSKGLMLLVTTNIMIRDIMIAGTCIFIPEPETIENLLDSLSQFI